MFEGGYLGVYFIGVVYLYRYVISVKVFVALLLGCFAYVLVVVGACYFLVAEFFSRRGSWSMRIPVQVCVVVVYVAYVLFFRVVSEYSLPSRYQSRW